MFQLFLSSNDFFFTYICMYLMVFHNLFGGLAEWSIYEVRLMFAIVRSDGNNTELYTARDIAHNWVKEKKKKNIQKTQFNCKKKKNYY